MGNPEFLLAVLDSVGDFWSTVIGHVLSWPVAFLVAVLTFRRPIKALLGRIRRLKTPAGDVLLQAELREIEEEIAETTSVETPDVDEAPQAASGDGEPSAAEGQESAGTSHEASPQGPVEAHTSSSGQPYVHTLVTKDNAHYLLLRERSDASIFDPPARWLDRPDFVVRMGWSLLSRALNDALERYEIVRDGRRYGPRLAAKRLLGAGRIDASLYNTVKALEDARHEIHVTEGTPSPAVARQFYRNASLLAARLDNLDDPSADGLIKTDSQD